MWKSAHMIIMIDWSTQVLIRFFFDNFKTNLDNSALLDEISCRRNEVLISDLSSCLSLLLPVRFYIFISSSDVRCCFILPVEDFSLLWDSLAPP